MPDDRRRVRRVWLAFGIFLAATAALTHWQTVGFGRPKALAGLVMAVMATGLLLREGQRRRAVRLRLADAWLWRQMGEPTLLAPQLLRGLALAAALVLLLLAAARPKGQLRATATDIGEGVDLMIAIDVSNSMRVVDMNGDSRLDAAKRLLGNFIGDDDGHRLGLLAFAGSADVVCPFTSDREVLKTVLEDVDYGSVDKQGTALGTAVREALETFIDDSRGHVLLMLTDGEDHASDPLGAAREAKKKGVVLYTVGLGTAEGDVVPMGTDPLDRVVPLKADGKSVISRLDEGTLKEMAETTGGQYFRADSPDRLRDVLLAVRSGAGRAASLHNLEMREDVFAWYLLPALLLLAIEPALRLRRKRVER